MFGQNSTWGQNNPQQQQPQQQGGGLFGGGGFGAPQQNAGGFGAPAGGFGQPAQQQNGGGLFGAAPANPTFGGFGAAAQPQQQQNNAFGARPAFGATGTTTFGGGGNAGGGMFGNTNTTNTFGAAANNNAPAAGGLFGRPATTSTFGASTPSNLFGAKPTNTFGNAPNVNQIHHYTPLAKMEPPIPAIGTNLLPYNPTWQQDPTAPGGTVQPNHLFHSITAVDPYRGYLWEELRSTDYQAGRKDAASGGGFVGQPAAAGGGFGQPAPAAGGFGATNTFGAAKPAGGLFGGTAANTGFGSTAATGGFGATAGNAGGGLFGAQPQQQQGGGLFGSANTNTNAGGLFGQPQQPAQPAGGGLFGNTNPFGGAAQQQPAATNSFGGFGAAAPKPAFGTGSTGFGAPAAPAAGGFGQPAQAPAAGGFTFGQQPQQQAQQQPAGGLFGGGFGATNNNQAQGTSLFGNTNQQQTQPAAGGLFGSTAQKPAGGLFGSTPAPATNAFGGFGQNTSQPAATGGMFGSTANNATGTGGGLFGNTQQQQPAQQPAAGGPFGGTSGGMFGQKPAAAPATGGLFGTQPQQPAPTGGLFGGAGQTGGMFGSTNNANQQNTQAKPAGTGMFGGGGGLFGLQNQTQAQQPATGGLFSNLGQSQPASTSMFGAQPQQQQNNLGGSLFGGNTSFGGVGGLGQSQQQSQQQYPSNLTASIDQNPYGTNNLFAYNGQKLVIENSVKKAALPPLTSSTFRVTPVKTPAARLRGFSSPRSNSPAPLSASGNRGSLYAGSPSIASDRYKGLTDAALSPNSFVARPSIKKLTVNPRASLGAEGGDKLDSILGKSILKTSTSSETQNTPPTSSIDRNGVRLYTPQLEQSNSTPLRRGTPLAQSSSSRPAVAGSERQPKKGEYWCKPKLEKLRQMTPSDLSSIPNFSAGCKGVGQVEFLRPVDLSQIPLDQLLGKIIIFTDRQIAVYPDEYPDKPDVGHGLNVPAEVMLENSWARDKGTKNPITDLEDARNQRLIKRLKGTGETEFVSFTDEGVWTFRVEHFSRYGLDSDDDAEVAGEVGEGLERQNGDESGSESRGASVDSVDDEDMLPPTKGLRDNEDEDRDSGLEDEGMYEEEDGDDETEDSGESSSGTSSASSLEDSLDPGDETSRSPTPPPYDPPVRGEPLGIAGMKKLREMQNSFFGEKVRVGRNDDAVYGLAYGEKQKLGQVKRLLEDREKDFEGAEGEHGERDNRAVTRTSFGEQPAQKTQAPRLRRPRQYARVDLVEDGSEGVVVDAGLALGRSFRCSWGPNGELVHFGKICKPNEEFTPPSQALVTIEDVSLLAEDEKVEGLRAERLLSLNLADTEIAVEDGVPYAIIDTSVRFHHFAYIFDAGDRSHEANLWRLGSALFDEIDLHLPEDADSDLTERMRDIRHKLALSKWLENAVAPSVDKDLVNAGDDRPAKIFALLSGNQLERAVQAAIEGGDLRLATLVAQIGGNDTFKEEVGRQLDDWKKYSAMGYIGRGYRKLYALLAGSLDVSPGEGGVGISEGLDWKRAFGLRMWYGGNLEITISDVIAEFDGSLKRPYPPATPIPPYLEDPSSNQLQKKWNMPNQPTDILFGMIKLYSDRAISLDSVLRARDASPSPTDVRVLWHLYQIVSRAMGRRDFEDRDENGYSALADCLTRDYASQLEVGGVWTWAAFVLLHLETAEGRGKALKSLLNRHPNPSDDEIIFLTETLQIPRQWLHQSKAAELASDGDKWGEFHALLEASEFADVKKAHKILVEDLAPEIVLRDDNVLLARLCEMFKGREPDGWEYGGKLFLDYLEILECPTLLESVVRAGQRPDPAQAAKLANIAQSLPRIIQLLPAVFPEKAGNVQSVAGLGDLLSSLYRIAGLLSDAGYIARPNVSHLLVDVDRLHLLQAAAEDGFEKSLALLTGSA